LAHSWMSTLQSERLEQKTEQVMTIYEALLCKKEKR
jgi:hypothetical protein